MCIIEDKRICQRIGIFFRSSCMEWEWWYYWQRKCLEIGKLKTFSYFASLLPQTKPPFYKLEDITVPTAVWNGGNDFIVGPQSINHLLPQLTNLVFHKYIPSWQHADFIWGLDVSKYLHEDIFHLMQNYR